MRCHCSNMNLYSDRDPLTISERLWPEQKLPAVLSTITLRDSFDPRSSSADVISLIMAFESAFTVFGEFRLSIHRALDFHQNVLVLHDSGLPGLA